MQEFNYRLNYAELDLRQHPELYRVGRGEQGVLLVEPYKSEILPHWRFATPEIAKVSSEKIYQLFLDYIAQGDFVGADMARKFIQMGYTRARRYANHKGGKKYDGAVPADKKGQSGAHGRDELPQQSQDLASAQIFKQKWDDARANPDYQQLKKQHQAKYENDSQYDNLPSEFFKAWANCSSFNHDRKAVLLLRLATKNWASTLD